VRRTSFSCWRSAAYGWTDQYEILRDLLPDNATRRQNVVHVPGRQADGRWIGSYVVDVSAIAGQPIRSCGRRTSSRAPAGARKPGAGAGHSPTRDTSTGGGGGGGGRGGGGGGGGGSFFLGGGGGGGGGGGVFFFVFFFWGFFWGLGGRSARPKSQQTRGGGGARVGKDVPDREMGAQRWPCRRVLRARQARIRPGRIVTASQRPARVRTAGDLIGAQAAGQAGGSGKSDAEAGRQPHVATMQH